MKGKIKYIVLISVSCLFLFSLSGWFMFKAPSEYSDSERRKLTPMPQLSLGSILDGRYMKDFEEAAPDQFPMRDIFRSIKAYAAKYIFRVKDNNDIYYADSHLSKLEYPMKENMLDHAADRIDFIYNTYLKDTDAKLYLSVVPDKNCFMAEKNGYLSLDYDKLAAYLQNKTPYLNYIDVKPLLSLDDYYFTDTHWRQENIRDIAAHISDSMGVPFEDNFTENKLNSPFYGVYYGQASLKVKPDEITYLTNAATDNAVVKRYDSGAPKKGFMYDSGKAEGKDPYEMFLMGTQPLITIENPSAPEKRELILFRDSFGSSLAPLLTGSYSKITVVDIRYVASGMLKNLVDFASADDVLFIYSTVLLNNSLAMK